MIKLKDLIKIKLESKHDKEIYLSNYNKEYTLKNLDCMYKVDCFVECGCIALEYTEEKSSLGNLINLAEKEKIDIESYIISWDLDLGNAIYLNEIIVRDKFILLL